jgi:hypothetical protein
MPKTKKTLPVDPYLAINAAAPLAAPDLRPCEPWQLSSVGLMQDRNATVAKVSVNQSSDYSGARDFEFTATGSSKREKGDRFNARTGELLALSRAYMHLSRKLYAAGRALVEPEPEVRDDDYALVEELAHAWPTTDDVPEDDDLIDRDGFSLEQGYALVEELNAAAAALSEATWTLRALIETE